MEREPEQLSFSFTYPPEAYKSDIKSSKDLIKAGRLLSLSIIGLTTLGGFIANYENSQTGIITTASIGALLISIIATNEIVERLTIRNSDRKLQAL
ncbi:MAG: hypothetical protein WEC80_02575 [Patescibacteria group bacterium]